MTKEEYYEIIRSVYSGINGRIRNGKVFSFEGSEVIDPAVDDRAASVIFRAGIDAIGSKKVFGEKSAIIIPARYNHDPGRVRHSVLEHVGFVIHADTDGAGLSEELSNGIACFFAYYTQLLQTTQGTGKTISDAGFFDDSVNGRLPVHLEMKGASLVIGNVPIGSPLTYQLSSRDTIKNVREAILTGAKGALSLKPLVKHGEYATMGYSLMGKDLEEYCNALKAQHPVDEAVRDSFPPLNRQGAGREVLDSGFALHGLADWIEHSCFKHFYYLPSTLSYIEEQESPPGVIVVGVTGELNTDEIEFLDTFSNAVWNAMSLMQVRRLRHNADQSAMRAGVSRVMGRSLSHGIGSGTLQKLSVPGELRKRLAVDKNRPDLTSMDPGADMLTMLRSAHAALCAPEANLDQVRALLAEAEQLYTETALMSPKAEDKLRHLFRVVKDRMELLSQVATVRSGMLETWSVADVVNAFNRSDVIVQPMLREGVYAKISFAQGNQAVGIVEGRIGVHGALFTLFENIIRNVSRHTNLDMAKFSLEAEPEDNLPLVRMVLRHTWNGTEEQLQRIKDALKKETLDASGAIRRHSWGLMEMKQVCAFLREMDMTEVDKEHDPPLLEIKKVDYDKHLSWLHHVFYLPKPRTLLKITLSQDGRPQGQDEAGMQVKQEDWVRYPIVGIDRTVNAQTIAQYLPNRCANLMDVHNMSGSELWRTYVEQQLNGKRGVKLHLYDHDDNKRTVCFGDQTSPLVGAVYHHPGVDPDKYERQAGTDHGALTMLHAMASNSPFSQVFIAMSNGGDHGDMWCARIAEATLTPIIILDERVQDAAWPATGQGIGHELQAMGVFVPDLGATADLRKTTPAKVDAFLTQLLSPKSWIKDVPKRYLIIHRSVMQRLNGIEGSEKYPAYFKHQGFEVSIVSGAAGGPEIGMGEEPYVPLAALEQHAIQVPCKWQLTELVVTARRPKVEPNKSTA